MMITAASSKTSDDQTTASAPAAESGQAELGLFNRELSWLEFNRRVLEEAQDRETPLLERLKFLAIFSTNLDEFFMVRVSGLMEELEEGEGVAPSPDGIGPARKFLDAATVKTAHDAGLTVTPYTFRSRDTGGLPGVREEMSHFLHALGVDALFTDNPDQFQREITSPAPTANQK